MQDTLQRRHSNLPPRRRPDRHALGLLTMLVLLAVAVGVAGFGYYDWCREASGPQTPVSIVVPEGASGSEVVDMLHERGVVRCGLVTKFLLTRSGLSDSIRAGTFELTTNMTPQAAFEALTRRPEPVPTVRLTIPEGYRLTQIAERVQQALGIPKARFLDEATSGRYSLPPYLPEGTKTTEGFLFPKTFELPRGQTTAADVVRRLLDQFRDEVQGLRWDHARQLGVTRYEVITIASMIEKEAAVPQDRAKIAAVIYNRLKKGMELGIDATLLYDDPTPGDGELTASDLESDSPYNTRIHTGLPPTPIASPGLASIEAALNPAHVDYLYYVLCGKDGHHAFTASYDRFLKLKQTCL